MASNINMSSLTHCFYADGATAIQDIALPVPTPDLWRGGYSGETPAQLYERTGAVLTPFEDALTLIGAAQRAKYVTPPVRIDAEAWMDALEVLPPARWTHGSVRGSETFHNPERICDTLVAWYVRDGDTHWRMVEDCRRSHAWLVDRCRNAAD